MLVVQSDRFNVLSLRTTICAIITATLRLGDAPGNVRLQRREAGLPRASVVNVTGLLAVDRSQFRDRIGALGRARIAEVDEGLRLVLGLNLDA